MLPSFILNIFVFLLDFYLISKVAIQIKKVHTLPFLFKTVPYQQYRPSENVPLAESKPYLFCQSTFKEKNAAVTLKALSN
jgi:hypothetical protein